MAVVHISQSHFDARFWRYLSIHLRFAARRWAKAERLRGLREPAILNGPTGWGDENAPADKLSRLNAPTLEIDTDIGAMPDDLREVVTDERLWAALQALTERQRDVLYLTAVAGRREAEIAAAWGVTQQAVSKTKRDAIRKLKARLSRVNGGTARG